MKHFVWFFVFTFIGCFSAWGVPVQKKRQKTKIVKEVSFDEILVQGRHHFSDEAVVTVEQDKVLDALLKIPKDFKDRIKASAKRN